MLLIYNNLFGTPLTLILECPPAPGQDQEQLDVKVPQVDPHECILSKASHPDPLSLLTPI